jgi:hypothetical protein
LVAGVNERRFTGQTSFRCRNLTPNPGLAAAVWLTAQCRSTLQRIVRANMCDILMDRERREESQTASES